MTNEMMSEVLKNDIKLAQGVGTLAESVSKAVAILATALLELEDPEANHCLRIGTRRALQFLAETEADVTSPYGENWRGLRNGKEPPECEGELIDPRHWWNHEIRRIAGTNAANSGNEARSCGICKVRWLHLHGPR